MGNGGRKPSIRLSPLMGFLFTAIVLILLSIHGGEGQKLKEEEPLVEASGFNPDDEDDIEGSGYAPDRDVQQQVYRTPHGTASTIAPAKPKSMIVTTRRPISGIGRKAEKPPTANKRPAYLSIPTPVLAAGIGLTTLLLIVSTLATCYFCCCRRRRRGSSSTSYTRGTARGRSYA